MAPPFDVGSPQKSLVRVPGSGTDKTSKPVCLEIAQIVNFPVQNILPKFRWDYVEELNRPLERSFPLLTASITVSVIRPQSSAQTTAAPTRKRALDNGTSSDSKRLNPSKAYSAEDLTTKEGRTTVIKNLLSDRKKLTAENEELKKKIAMFKDILRDRRKVDQFLLAMEQLAAC